MITPKKHERTNGTKERERRVKLKTQPFLPWHFNDCRNNLEEFSRPSPTPGVRERRADREREKRSGGERRKGAKF